ncbi:hypothetical protein T440DRAFT_81868 [Plenodomus tracheiphilus IPT5]|uniref:Uncharacterized protein n=1 Tax=Plenodomus tracheiphilus IPT5 TaxID=1408161 RepID=A0A6A7B8G0_9PLEO|nr:hypothetical protein T440DRAFT_81868 [Plenodomus tracheiphilus IPT5]
MPGLEQIIPRPDSRELLPPLLACLSTATASKQVPPGLLPLLSPILRQRVQLLSSTSTEWLSLLCWDKEVASRLPRIIEKITVEPHPSSGEIEVEEPDRLLYRRSDPETLHTRLVLGEFALVPTYLWCTNQEGGSQWLLAELRGTADEDDGTEWFEDLSEANEAGFRRKPVRTNSATSRQVAPRLEPEPAAQEAEDEDDGSYWAAYDQTPAQTPALKRSPAPGASSRTPAGPSQSELEYFARYASEVQPALDAHDPDEENPATGQSTLNGNALNYTRQSQTEPLETSNLGPNGYDSSLPPTSTFGTITSNGLYGNDSAVAMEGVEAGNRDALNHPRPSSSASTNSVERLERKAEFHSQAELAIKQHISTDIKSLFRLAKASGIDREEFERIVQRELEVLPMLEEQMS